MIHIIKSKEDLNQKIAEAGEKLIVIDFFATWCGPCKLVAPKLEELASQYADHALILKVDVDDNEEISVEYNVSSMPTFMFVRNRKILEIFVGGNSDKLFKCMQNLIEAQSCKDHLQVANIEEQSALPLAPRSIDIPDPEEPKVAGKALIEKVISEEGNIN